MADETAGDDARYWAFISYSHNDAGFGRWLHRRLENYSVPRRLTGRPTAGGPVPRKLVPIFRDREELPAASDLSAEVRAALKASRSLIVVCSPSAVASHWVSREIEVFRELHPDRPVLAAVRDGEPSECFPQALRVLKADGTAVEPLAADFRRGRDGEQLGLLKLIAGIIGIGLDELVQRDAHRRTQRVTAVTAGALAGMLVMSVLTVFALTARQEAERQRAEAEGLIDYMLTDLREKLKGVGRLDIMSAVNRRALKYYDGEIDDLSPNSRAQRARILHRLGDDDEHRGDMKTAFSEFRDAYQTTKALLDADPRNPQRIFDHAQSEFYIGLSAYDFGHHSKARDAFLAYKALADKLALLAPENPEYRLQVGEANSTLCVVTLTGRTGTPGAAIEYCDDALSNTEEAARRMPLTGDLAANLIDRHAWLADAYLANGEIEKARSERLAQERILGERMTAEPKNMDYKDTWVALQRALAALDTKQGNKIGAEKRINRALAAAVEMTSFDPANNEWAELRRSLEKEAKALHQANQKDFAK